MMLSPITAFEGAAFTFDFPGLSIGVAEYEEGPTGCTVFHFDPGVSFAADVRGGSVGQVHADIGFADAICFAGGSLLGLEAASGVAAGLHARRGHEHTEWTDVPVVPGAIIFDFGLRTNGIYADAVLGRAAIDAAKPGVFPLGRRGAGRNASVGKAIEFTMAEAAGQGAAMRQAGPARLVAFVVLNSLGAIFDRAGALIRGNQRPDGTRVPFGGAGDPRPGNTTLTLVVTNLKATLPQLEQAARQAHASMARAIQPFHTELDGDVLFFATTNAIDHPPLLAPAALGTLAGETIWDAVLAAFP